MRTKALLLSAATLVAGITIASAQVYSQNVVGYINITLNEGFNMIANQLDADQTGTNNTVSAVFGTNVPRGTTVYTWNGTSWDSESLGARTGTWSTPDNHLNPGSGTFIYIPIGAYGGGTSNVTVTGNVLQGNLVNGSVSGAGFNVLSSQVPISGGLQTALNYVPQGGDTVYIYNLATGLYDTYSYGSRTHVWSPSEPVINVGQSFWLYSSATPSWTNNFVIP